VFQLAQALDQAVVRSAQHQELSAQLAHLIGQLLGATRPAGHEARLRLDPLTFVRLVSAAVGVGDADQAFGCRQQRAFAAATQVREDRVGSVNPPFFRAVQVAIQSNQLRRL
jgi:hypothetical protein